ncbi:MAG: thioredoxin domain-containing protein [Kofleriaceae bacterium]|nr:thioredoxin domain-containing protein [Kofleriaceae bacterium]
MKTVLLTLISSSLLFACQNDSKLDGGGGGALEARVKKLEEQNAKYAEALDFLQKVYGQQKAQQQAQEESEPDPNAMFAVDIAQNVKEGFVEGPASGAPVTIVAAEDFACPYCERVSGTLDELVKEYDGKVRVVFKNMVVHPQVINAHYAGCAAAKQGKFQQFKTTWWEKGFKARKMDDANIEAIAKEIGLDMGKFKSDKDGAECQALVDAAVNEMQKFKVNSTPTLFVNGTHVGGALPKEAFKQMIDEKLKVAANQPEYYDKVVMATGVKQFKSKKDSATN